MLFNFYDVRFLKYRPIMDRVYTSNLNRSFPIMTDYLYLLLTFIFSNSISILVTIHIKRL